MTVELEFKALQAIAALQRPNKPNLLEKVVGLFESESPKCIEQVLTGVESGDLESIRVGAHSLKSSCANVGAMSLSARCKDIEAAAREGDLSICTQLSDGMMAEFQESVVGIREFLERAA